MRRWACSTPLDRARSPATTKAMTRRDSRKPDPVRRDRAGRAAGGRGARARRGRGDWRRFPASTISTYFQDSISRRRIPKHLMERFPDEMTIVIQHRFWDLKVEEDNFSVGLSFGGVPATLHVPFAAVTQFHDPAVEFALTFQADAEEAPHEEHEEAENEPPTEVAEVDRKTVQRRQRGFHAKKVTPLAVNLSLIRRPNASRAVQDRFRAVPASRGSERVQHDEIDMHTDPHRKRQLRPDRGPRRRLLGRADRAFDREFPVRPARADAARDRPRARPRQAGRGAGERAHRRTRPQDRRGDPAGRRARSRAAISTASSRWSSGRPGRARSRT